MNKKDLTKIVAKTIDVMNLTETDLKKGREFAVGFLIGDARKQLEILEYLKTPCEISRGKLKIEISLFQKFRRHYVRIRCG